MKKVVALFMSLVLVFGAMIPAAIAADMPSEMMEPRYVRIATVETDFYIDNSGKTTDYCMVKTANAKDKIELTMELQRFENNNWKTIKTWSGSGTGVACLDKTWYVVSGYEYQLKITSTVYDQNDVWRETATDYSNSEAY